MIKATACEVYPSNKALKALTYGPYLFSDVVIRKLLPHLPHLRRRSPENDADHNDDEQHEPADPTDNGPQEGERGLR